MSTYWLLIIVGLTLVACVPPDNKNATASPATTQVSGPAPSRIKFDVRPAPSLTGSTDAEVKKSALEFIDWAAGSTADQHDAGREAIKASSANDGIAKALYEEALRLSTVDHSRALIALSVLGEMRNPSGQRLLLEFVNQPLPSKGTEVEGIILEQEALATLEAKAVQGLAYMNTGTALEQTLQVIGQHPSRVVRAAAIEAFLFNFGDNADTRGLLSQYVTKAELVFLDRPRRVAGESNAVFNAKLDAYFQVHPELIAPNPQPGDVNALPALDPIAPETPPAR
jgi:hypothetical protein